MHGRAWEAGQQAPRARAGGRTRATAMPRARLRASPRSSRCCAARQRKPAHLNTRYGRPVGWAYSISATSSAPEKAMAMSVPKVARACGVHVHICACDEHVCLSVRVCVLGVGGGEDPGLRLAVPRVRSAGWPALAGTVGKLRRHGARCSGTCSPRTDDLKCIAASSPGDAQARTEAATLAQQAASRGP